ncbi:hypothetical protein RvY_00498 [Ramazzottius varieornatus]|uniref:Uncharacterized protein n=1 Tax=Ramazzottius varieornatus TaxID=947166 RepID=A0A1D1UH12_RAMVA|nr:hypothetical protein RvY_00498 [Ramazzottius varieornatus]
MASIDTNKSGSHFSADFSAVSCLEFTVALGALLCNTVLARSFSLCTRSMRSSPLHNAYKACEGFDVFTAGCRPFTMPLRFTHVGHLTNLSTHIYVILFGKTSIRTFAFSYLLTA